MFTFIFSSIENIRLAIGSVLSNRLRAFLTTIGITIGVASVVVLLSVGQAFETFITDQFQSIGTNLVSLFGKQNEDGNFEPLTEGELEALSDPLRVPSALFSVPFVTVNDTTPTVVYEDRSTSPSILGITPTYLEVEQREVLLGRYIDETDQEGSARVAVLGSSAVDNLFPPGVYPLEQTIRVNGIPFRVVGVLSKGGSGGFFDADNTVFIPLRTAQTRLTSERAANGDYIVSQIVFKAGSEAAVTSLVNEITEVIRAERNIEFNGEDDFVISTQASLLDSVGTILRLLTYFLAAIASISLLVGGIGIMNIMLVTVTERTKEIGLRKAVGAKNYDILLQFVTEAILLSLIGGGVGIAIAALGGVLINQIPGDLNVTVDPFSVFLALGISTSIGVGFGIFPAWRAANLNPIDALRYE
ncbi:MAG: ABC transporter permease [Phototrophicaceae bacterium]|jgi:putative ABC transport system permease protein